MPETMTEQIAAVRICATQKCKRPLTFLGPPQNCWRCLVCNPIVETKPAVKPRNKRIDVAMTESMVREIIKEERLALAEMTTSFDEDKIREIVRDELADWHIQKPPVTATEVAEAVGAGGTIMVDIKPPKPETWLQKAKRIGVQTHKESGGMRKKAEIMAEIETKERETDEAVPEEFHTEEQTGSGGGERPSVDKYDAKTPD